jgi:glycosyltransferase involved in cell wall biosynthesis
VATIERQIERNAAKLGVTLEMVVPWKKDLGLGARVLNYFSTLLRFRRLVTTQQWRVGHIHVSAKRSFFRDGIFALAAAGTEASVMMHFSGSGTVEYWRPRWRRWVSRPILKAVAAAAIVGPETDDIVRGIHDSTKRVEWVSIPSIEPVPARKDPPGRPLRLLFLGGSERRKGLDLLVTAFERHPRLAERYTVSVAGVERDRSLESSASALGFRRLGWLETADLRDELVRSDVYCHPSRAERLPGAVLDAMRAGCVTVASAIAELPVVIEDGTSGFLVPPNDADALGTCLLRIAEIDDESLIQVQNAAIQTIDERYSEKRMLSILHRFYLEQVSR